MTIQFSKLNDTLEHTVTGSGKRAARPTWQTPIPSPARTLASCTNVLSVRSVNRSLDVSDLLSYPVPALLVALGLLQTQPLAVSLGLIWIAHIG